MDRHAFFEGGRMNIKIHDAAVGKVGNRFVGNVLQGDNDLHHVWGFGDIAKIMSHADGEVLIDDFRQGASRRTCKAFKNADWRTGSGIVGPSN